MAFFKFRERGPQGNEGRNAAVSAPAESIEAMRRRARHRLLGAAVLVLIGVVGFPLLFDTQPRPVAVDIPIEIPDRNKAKPLAAPPPVAAPDAGAATKPSTPPAPASDAGMITEAADGTEIPSSRLAAAAPAAPEVKPEPAPAPKPEAKPERKPEPKPEAKPEPKPRQEAKAEPKPEPKPAKPADDGDRARALLEGKGASAAAAKPAAAADDNGRFVVQVGAFADADKAREVRQKLEKAGLKTYTNVAKTADGERTRVRVGPFASRAEADKAAGKVKGLSLPAAVLSL
ncbi:MAG: SPOR domain-containing protein [Variovorax sp.]|nr:SPOR domain-containing protein [Variovorax sp.]